MAWREWNKASQARVPLARPIDGWRQGASDVYTCVPPPGYEKDPAVTAAIREFDSGIIPIWRVQSWLPPRSVQPIRVVHHGIGRFYPYPRFLRHEFHVEMPQNAQHPTPNFLDAIFEDAEITRRIGPPAYIPWDWDTYRWCRKQFVYLTTELYEARLEAKRKAIEKAMREHSEEIQYGMADFEKWAVKHLEKNLVTEQDWKAYAELLRTGRQGGRRRAVTSELRGRPLSV